jgi:mannose-6-phosphate isomerase-like protein (cupin superfamily)
MALTDAGHIRRVVTGDNADGLSATVWDGHAPNVHMGSNGPSRNHADIWAWDQERAPLDLERDDGDMKYDFPGPLVGGHVRVIEMVPKPNDYDPATDTMAIAPHEPKLREPGRAWDRGGRNLYTSQMHMTETVDYGILMSGQRSMRLDDCEVVMRPGDIVVQLGAWHQWSSPVEGCLMAFDMISAKFEGPAEFPLVSTPAVAEGVDSIELAHRTGSVRRLVVANTPDGLSRLVSDGPSGDVVTDPARPGYRSALIWASSSSPASVSTVAAARPHWLVPPVGGSVCRIETVPPDSAWSGQVTDEQVDDFFRKLDPDGLVRRSVDGPHPYLQKTDALELCFVLHGEPTLVLETGETALDAGDVVVVRGNARVFSNRSDSPAIVAVVAHDGQRGEA